MEVILLASEYLPLVGNFFVKLLGNSSHLRVNEGPKDAKEKYNDFYKIKTSFYPT